MDWGKEIDQQLLMPIGKLIELLAYQPIEADALICDGALSGTAPSTSDKLSRHQLAIIKLLEKGGLLGKVKILRGDKSTIRTLREVRRALPSLRRAAKPSMVCSRSFVMPLWTANTEARNKLDTCIQIASELLIQVKKLEIAPGDVVRWMNSVHEGQKLLPSSLRDYLSAPTKATMLEEETGSPEHPGAGKHTKATGIEGKKTKKRLAVTQKEAAALFHCSERTIRNWDNGINTPPGYPRRGSASALSSFAFQWHGDKKFKAEAVAKIHAQLWGDIDSARLKGKKNRARSDDDDAEE